MNETSYKKKNIDTLNFLKSELKFYEAPKLGKTQNPYMISWIKKLIKLLEVENIISENTKKPFSCKYVKREGESCTLNNNCTYPNCK